MRGETNRCGPELAGNLVFFHTHHLARQTEIDLEGVLVYAPSICQWTLSYSDGNSGWQRTNHSPLLTTSQKPSVPGTEIVWFPCAYVPVSWASAA